MTVFDGVVEFVALAETQGFTAAGRKLAVSTSHISRRVAALESRLGTALVARSTRSVRLTVAGQNYYERCRELLHGMDEANMAVSSEHVELSGTLRVSAAGEFAENVVVPILIDFARQHPSLNIDIDFNSRMVNFVEEGIDFAIRYGRLVDSGLIARKLVDRSLMAAASPEYLKRRGTPRHPKELEHHDCILAASERWQFNVDSKPFELKVRGRWRSNSGRSVVRACQAGLGIAYMPRSSFGDALQDGSLLPLLEDYHKHDSSSWIVYANRRYLPVRARLAVNFLLKRFESWWE